MDGLPDILTGRPFLSPFLREYHIKAGKTEMAASLKEQFPGEEEAIDEFMRLVKVGGHHDRDGIICENYGVKQKR